MICKSKFKDLRQGDVLENVLISKVIYKQSYNKKKEILFEFVCDCGNTQLTKIGNFKRKPQKVCTLCSIESVAKQKEKYLLKDRALYAIWKNMNWRCDEVKGNPAYIKKGIKVCTEWSESNPEGFNNFLKDMHPREGNKTLERVDNTKGYSASNCKWATVKEQQNNRENNHILYYEGKNWTLQQLSEEIGLKSNTLLCRLRRGWSIEEAVSGKKAYVYKRPYTNVMTDTDFYNMMYDLLENKLDQVSVGLKYGVSPSNLSRIMRAEEPLTWYHDYKGKFV